MAEKVLSKDAAFASAKIQIDFLFVNVKHFIN